MKTQKKSARTSVQFSKSKTTDQESERDDADSPPAAADSSNPAPGGGVVKTKVAVAGSNKKIPKTIVEADDHAPAPTAVATLEPEKLRPEVTPAQRSAISQAPEATSQKSGATRRNRAPPPPIPPISRFAKRGPTPPATAR